MSPAPMWDEWQIAFLALIAARPSNPAPLVALLRSGAPIPTAARDVLAELLSPGDPEFFHRRLVVIEEGGEDAFRNDARKIAAARTYNEFRGYGMTSEESARAAGQEHHIGERTIFRSLHFRKAWRERMAKVLFDDDDDTVPDTESRFFCQ
jgi:hypothetical protein